MDYLDAVKVLKGIPLFASLDQPKLKLLAFASEYHSFDDGESVFRVGDPSDSVYIVDEGEADVLIDQDGGEVLVNRLTKDGLIGEMGIFRNQPRSASVRAKRMASAASASRVRSGEDSLIAPCRRDLRPRR